MKTMPKEIVSEKTDSIKIGRTSTGKYTWEIKCYYDGTKEDEGFILQKIDAIDISLRDKYGKEGM